MTQPNQDEAIDKALAALRNSAPPVGMNVRIAQRLGQIPSPAPGRWNRLRSSTPTAAWWRGAATGAAAAMLATSVFLFAAHLLHTHSSVTQTTSVTASKRAAAPALVAVGVLGEGHPMTDTSALPCARFAILRPHAHAEPIETTLRAGSPAEATAPSHPAPELPLTAEERQLAHLARTADPDTLATINPESQAKMLSREAADFEQFFAPPLTPSARQDNE